ALGGLSEGLTGLVTSASGLSHVFQWNAFPDVGGGDVTALVRITPTDAVSGAPGTAGVSPAFAVLNSRVTTIAGRGTHTYGLVAGATADGNGVLYFSERFGHRIYALNTGTTRVTAVGTTLNPGQLKRVAGTGLPGFNGDHQPGVDARLNDPGGLAADLATPPNLFVADTANHRVRRIDGVTGYITTVTGDGTVGTNDGLPANQGRVNGPEDVAVDPFGNLFIADTGNNVIRAVNFGTQNLAVGGSVIQPQWIRSVCGAFPPNPPFGGDGGAAPSALLNGPASVVFDAAGHLYIADTGNQRVRAVNTSVPPGGPSAVFGNVTINAGNIDTIAGSGGQGYAGDGVSAVNPMVLLDGPRGLLVLANGIVLVSEAMNHTVRAVHSGPSGAQPITVGSRTLQPGWIDTVAGLGPTLRGLAGDGGDSTSARLDAPWGLALASGSVVIADAGNRRVRAFNPNPTSGTTSVSPAGLALAPGVIDTLQASPGFPVYGPAAVYYRSNIVFIADAGGHRAVMLDTLTDTAVPIAGDGFSGFTGDSGPALSARFNGPTGIVVDGLSGKVALVADTGNQRIRAVHFDTATGGAVTAFGVTVNPGEVESVPATLGNVTFPSGLATGPNGDLYIADTGGDRIVRVDRATGALTVVAGTGTAGDLDGARLTTAQFQGPEGLAVSSAGNLYVADTGNHTLRLVNMGSSAIVYGSGPSQITVAPGDVGRIGGISQTPGWDGEGRDASLSLLDAPVGVTVDGFGAVTFTERGNHRVRRMIAVSGTLVAVAGGGTAGFNGDGGPMGQTLFDAPEGLATNGLGDYFLADRNNGRVRRFRAP
ncbi:MAG: NHL domain-containing protein, partial [Planctomycetota bacterium]